MYLLLMISWIITLSKIPCGLALGYGFLILYAAIFEFIVMPALVFFFG